MEKQRKKPTFNQTSFHVREDGKKVARIKGWVAAPKFLEHKYLRLKHFDTLPFFFTEEETDFYIEQIAKIGKTPLGGLKPRKFIIEVEEYKV